MMRSEIDEPEIPSGIAIFGSDDAARELYMLYFDERGVSRKYQVSFQDNILNWRRDSPDFSQRCTLQIADDGRTIISTGQMMKDGDKWEQDLKLTFTRVS